MYSRPLSNAARLAAAVFFATPILAGCRSGGIPVASSAGKTPAYVDMVALQRRHPLTEERERLRRTSATPVVATGDVGGGGWAALLPAALPGGLETGNVRAPARARLVGEVAKAEEEEAAARAARRARRLEQRRAELLAAERGALAEQQQLLREQTDLRTREALEARVGTLSHLKTAEQIYRAQIREGVLGPAEPEVLNEETKRLRPLIGTPPIDAGTLRASVDRLKGPLDFLPTPRSRMTVMAEAAGSGARRVKSQLDSIWEAGLLEREEVARRARAEMEARVEERLRVLASTRRQSTRPNRDTIAQELARTLEGEQELAGQRVAGAEGKRVALAVPSSRRVGVSTSNRAALLERLLAEDVRARVRDAAQRQRLALREAPTPGVADRTAEIGGWVGLAEGREVRK